MIFLNIWPTTVEGWVGLVILVVGLITSLVKLIPTLVKLKKATKEIIKNKDLKKLRKIAMSAMSEVQSLNICGEEKLQIVIKVLKTSALEMGVEIDDDTLKELVEGISELKQFFKEMKNADEKQEG